MRKYIKIHTFYFCLSFLIICTSCNTILLPGKQNLVFKAPAKESQLFLDYNDTKLVGGYKEMKIKKLGTRQLVTRVSGCKDNYSVLFPFKRVAMVPVFLIGSGLTSAYLGIMLDLNYNVSRRFYKYPDTTFLKNCQKYPSKQLNQKYIDFGGCTFNFKNLENDYQVFKIKYDLDLENKIKNDSKEFVGKGIESFEYEKAESYEDRATSKIYNSMKKYGFIDTLNTVFDDNNSIIKLEVKVNKLKKYFVRGRSSVMSRYTNFEKIKIETTWIIKNLYNEVLDSVIVVNTSGDFSQPRDESGVSLSVGESLNEDIFVDAMENAYVEVMNTDKINKYLNQTYKLYEKTKTNTLLKLKPVVSPVQNIFQSLNASVIVKRKDGGHGSGFVVAEDGYIITNFHVISDKYNDKYAKLTVLTNDGEELDAEVIRVNKVNDIALLKVQKQFKYSFNIDDVNVFQPLKEVYAVGAPKYIELGNTVSKGILTNLRTKNNNNLIQINIKINSGNSGGPLFDKEGGLYGVIQAKLVGVSTEGIGFAIPASLIKEALEISY